MPVESKELIHTRLIIPFKIKGILAELSVFILFDPGKHDFLLNQLDTAPTELSDGLCKIRFFTVAIMQDYYKIKRLYTIFFTSIIILFR